MPPFSFEVRQNAINGRMFHSRAGGILNELTGDLTEYNHLVVVLPYAVVYPGPVPAGTILVDQPNVQLHVQQAANDNRVAMLASTGADCRRGGSDARA